MPPESMPERVRKVAGSDALGDLGDFDPTNELHVDRAAGVLLKRFRDADDSQAFGLLIELTVDRLVAMAEDIASELGLGTDSSQLVTDDFKRMFVDCRPLPRAPLHFLADAAERLRQDAETTIRDLALSDPHDPQIPTIWEDGHPKAPVDPDELATRATHVAFHRLDLPYRRVLRMKNILGLPVSEIATRLGLPQAEAEQLLLKARERLSHVVDEILKGGAA